MQPSKQLAFVLWLFEKIQTHYVFRCFNILPFLFIFNLSICVNLNISSVTRQQNKRDHFSKNCPNSSHCSLYLKSDIFQNSPNMYVGHFCETICCQDLSKIAQSEITLIIPSRELRYFNFFILLNVFLCLFGHKF